MKKYLIIFFIAAITACTPEKKQTDDEPVIVKKEEPKAQVPEYMVGEWKLVTMISYQDGDTAIMAPADLGISLVSTNNADGSFKDIYNGEESQGTFELKNDTAIFNYDSNMKRLFIYEFTNDTLYYTGRLNGQLMTSGFVKEI